MGPMENKINTLADLLDEMAMLLYNAKEQNDEKKLSYFKALTMVLEWLSVDKTLAYQHLEKEQMEEADKSSTYLRKNKIDKPDIHKNKSI